MRFCKYCETWKDEKEFYKLTNGYYRGRCKICHNISVRQSTTPEKKKDRELRRYYGITLLQYSQMVTKQEGKCAICGKQPDVLHVDHDHITGQVRKLLCNACNLALGMVNEDIEILQSMIQYLLS